jgi:hypothetical protein
MNLVVALFFWLWPEGTCRPFNNDSVGLGCANGRSGRDWGKDILRVDDIPGRAQAEYAAAGLSGERGVIWSVVAAADGETVKSEESSSTKDDLVLTHDEKTRDWESYARESACRKGRGVEGGTGIYVLPWGLISSKSLGIRLGLTSKSLTLVTSSFPLVTAAAATLSSPFTSPRAKNPILPVFCRSDCLIQYGPDPSEISERCPGLWLPQVSNSSGHPKQHALTGALSHWGFHLNTPNCSLYAFHLGLYWSIWPCISIRLCVSLGLF